MATGRAATGNKLPLGPLVKLNKLIVSVAVFGNQTLLAGARQELLPLPVVSSAYLLLVNKPKLPSSGQIALGQLLSVIIHNAAAEPDQRLALKWTVEPS